MDELDPELIALMAQRRKDGPIDPADGSDAIAAKLRTLQQIQRLFTDRLSRVTEPAKMEKGKQALALLEKEIAEAQLFLDAERDQELEMAGEIAQTPDDPAGIAVNPVNPDKGIARMQTRLKRWRAIEAKLLAQGTPKSLAFIRSQIAATEQRLKDYEHLKQAGN